MAATSEIQVEGQQGTESAVMNTENGAGPRKRVKLHGRAFYESIGSPKLVLAPMVEQSEFVCAGFLFATMLPSPERFYCLYEP
jgi:tRNA-dihydrouridine synthase 1